MTGVKKISDEFSVGGQPTPVDLKQLADQGFRPVVNLRSPNEVGALADEQQQAENVGLQYVNVPVPSIEANADLTATVLAAVKPLPTPVFFIVVPVDELAPLP